jgi:hypothetical protein
MGADRQAKPAETAVFFARHPVFRLEELAAELSPQRDRAAARSRVKYHLHRGRLRAITRGVYAVVPVGVAPSRFHPDRYLVGRSLRPDALFSHHAALELLGAAHSDWNTCTIVTATRRAPVRLDGVSFRFVLPPPALRRGGLLDLGTRRVERAGLSLHVTGPERTLLDGFRQPGLVGGLEELVESAAGFGVLDLGLLENLLDAYRQKVLWAAVGWFLEQYRRSFFVTNEYLKRVRRNRPASPHYLPRSHRRGGVFLPRWNLVLPRTVVRMKEPDEA